MSLIDELDQAIRDDVEVENSLSLNDFVLVEVENIKSSLDDVVKDVDYLNELKTSTRATTDATMFVERRLDGERFVLKRISPDSFSKSMAKLAMALTETDQLRKLSHVNLVQVFDAFHDEGHLYLLCEYVPGGNLARFIKSQHGVLIDEDTIVGWFRQLVTGLMYLHTKYVVHGNIKPENILLSENHKMVRFSDYGLAKVFDQVGLSFYERPGYSSSQLYAAPETTKTLEDLESVRRSGTAPYINDDIFSAGEKADVWSLGVVIYELATLKRPFSGIRSLMTQKPGAIPTKYSNDFQATVWKMLEKYPWDRIDVGSLSKEPLLNVRRILKDPSRTPSRANTPRQEPERGLEMSYTAQEFEEFEVNLARSVDKNDADKVHEICRLALGKSETLLRRLLDNSRDNACGDTPLHFACRRGYHQTAKALVDNGADVMARNKEMDTPLHVAASEGHEKCCAAILDNSEKVDVNAHGVQGRTALHMAVGLNHLEIAKVLLSRGANADDRSSDDDHAITPLHLAAFYGHLEMIKLLHQAGANLKLPDKSKDQPLHAAARAGQSTAVELLIDLGANKEACGYNGRSALHHAILKGHSNVIATLIKKGVDINAKNPDDKLARTPLHVAVSRRSIAVINQLIDAKVAWLRGDAHGDTAMHLAASKGYASIVETFIAKGLSVDTQNDVNGWTCLHVTAASGHLNVMLLLLKRHADMEIASKEKDGKRTALHVAIAHGHVEMARTLLQSGASMMTQDGKGDVALGLAAAHDQPSMIKLLTENFGANVDMRLSEGRTALHVAAKLDKYYAAKALLERLANTELKNTKGLTPFCEALIAGNMTTAELLWSWGASPEAIDDQGYMPIHMAVMNQQPLMIEFLVRQARVNIEAIGPNLKTPLQMACLNNFESCVEMLLSLGADKNVKTGDDVAQTPLHIAAFNGFAQILRLLIKAQTRVDIKNWKDETALMLAIQQGHLECARILLQDGRSNVEQVGFEGRRPIHYAIETGKADLVRLVALDANASLDCRSDAKESPFQLSARLGNVAIGRILLGKQRDLIDQVNEQGETALHIATTHGHDDYVKFLVDNGFDPDRQDRRGATPINLAASQDAENTKILDYMRQKSASASDKTI